MFTKILSKLINNKNNKTTYSTNNNNRPEYLSDKGNRPKYRGYSFKLIQDNGITQVWLSLYIIWGIITYINTDYRNIEMMAYVYRPTIILLVRILHALNIYRNHYLSDKLHNNDIKYGEEYLNPEKIKIIQEQERKIHAEDWIAALGIIVSHHFLFTLVFLDPFKVDVVDISLLVIHIGIMYSMYKKINYELITEDKKLFKKFKMTFGIQTVKFCWNCFSLKEYNTNPLKV